MNTPTNIESPTFQDLSWHQQQKIRRDHATRNLPAHIRGDDWHTSLCGHKNPRVTVDAEHRDNPANLTCKRCKVIADKCAESDKRGKAALSRWIDAMETGCGNAPELTDNHRPAWSVL